MLFSGKSRRKGTAAGLALHEDSLRYIELAHAGSGFQVVRQEIVPMPAGAIVKGSIQQFDVLEQGLEELRGQVGKFTYPVVLGVPSRDVILRLVEYPRMPLEDIRDALALEFEKYFPYSWSEAAADLAEVEVPVSEGGGSASSTILVATTRLDYMKNLIRAAERIDLPLGAIEPMNVAFFRASLGSEPRAEACFIVGIEPEVTHIMLGYKDNGILYRSTLVDLRDAQRRETEANLMPIFQDIQNTKVFARNQYRGMEISHLILGGSFGENDLLKKLLEGNVTAGGDDSSPISVSFSDVWSSWGITSSLGKVPGYDTSIGLALRNVL